VPVGIAAGGIGKPKRGVDRGMMDRKTGALVLGLVGSLVANGAMAAGGATAANLTGTWKGLQVCDDNRGGDQDNFVADDRVEITQTGQSVRLRRVAQDGSRALIYQGRVAPITGSARVEALVSVCGGAYVAQEMVRLRRVLTNADGSGRFDAESLYESSAVPGLEGTEILGTCKWAYQRVSADDPGVPVCRQ
jgi:hypothetical protein